MHYPRKEEIFKLPIHKRYLQWEKSKSRQNFRAGAISGAGVVIQIYSSAEPDPKEIFAALQTLLSRSRIRIKLLAKDPDQESDWNKTADKGFRWEDGVESNRKTAINHIFRILVFWQCWWSGSACFRPTGSGSISQRYGSGSLPFLIKVLIGLK
jgi:hypothetical protein